MNRQEKNAVSQEERKEKIRARYKGVDRSELEFIPVPSNASILSESSPYIFFANFTYS